MRKTKVANEFDPKDCPVGITNSKDIQYLGERLDMAIEKLTEKVGDIKQDVETLNKNMNTKFDKIDKRFDEMDNKIDTFKKEMDTKIEGLKSDMPNQIDNEVDRLRGKAALRTIGWVFLGVGGSCIIYIASRALAKVFGL